MSSITIARNRSISNLKITEVVTFSSLFVALSVALPYIAHQFHLAGPTFLPMHIFVLLAGLLFGWKTGFIVGAMTPLVSFATSGMPPLAILPFLLAEITVYGFVAGLLREKTKLPTIVSLLSAMLAGRIVLILIYSFTIGGIAAIDTVYSAVSIGLPGIVIQLLLLPIVIPLLKKRFGFVRND